MVYMWWIIGWWWLEHEFDVSLYANWEYIIIPSDEVIFFRGMGIPGIPPTRRKWWMFSRKSGEETIKPGQKSCHVGKTDNKPSPEITTIYICVYIYMWYKPFPIGWLILFYSHYLCISEGCGAPIYSATCFHHHKLNGVTLWISCVSRAGHVFHFPYGQPTVGGETRSSYII